MKLNTNLKLLVVDDMSSMRQVLQNMLKELGFKQITMVDNGKKALDILRSGSGGAYGYDLVISDWNMPELTGVELLKLIREDAKLKKIPFLLVTSEAEQENLVLAIKEGVTSFIVKPFNEEILKNHLEKIQEKMQSKG